MGNAVVWILTHGFLEEGARSAESAKRYLPDADRILLTPESYSASLFTKVIQLAPRKHAHWYLDEVNYLRQLHALPYEKIIFLDSDMLLVNDCSDLWVLLDKFDLALAHAPTRQTAPPLEPIPPSFVEYCTGIVAFRNNPMVATLFQDWYNRYAQNVDKYQSPNNDQVALRETLWNTTLPIKLVALSDEWNCRFGLGGRAIKPVRILHGRFTGEMSLVNSIVNAKEEIRIWHSGDFVKALGK